MHDYIIQTEPIIKLNEHIFNTALAKNASDIHIEPHQKNYRVRLRVNHILEFFMNIENNIGLQLINRLKVLAELNVTERRFPQDGHIEYNLSTNTKIDIRINITPTYLGEKIALRFLKTHENFLYLDQLGFSSHELTTLKHLLQKPHGLMLVTGPTGSGKSTTLYSILSYLNTIAKNITTVEDPIEMTLLGINQCHTHAAIGIKFETLLRSILRQDPDILMIGEIRDANTAKIALQASQTGHLILSSLHTHTAIDAIDRLYGLKLEKTPLLQSLSLIISQRIIRVLCSHCKTKVQIIIDHIAHTIYQANSCAKCQSGYSAITAVFELLIFDENLKNIFQETKSAIIAYLKKNKYEFLHDKILEHLLKGNISLEEFIRVMGYSPCEN